MNVQDLTVRGFERPDHGYLDEGANRPLTVAQVTRT